MVPKKLQARHTLWAHWPLWVVVMGKNKEGKLELLIGKIQIWQIIFRKKKFKRGNADTFSVFWLAPKRLDPAGRERVLGVYFEIALPEKPEIGDGLVVRRSFWAWHPTDVLGYCIPNSCGWGGSKMARLHCRGAWLLGGQLPFLLFLFTGQEA